MVFLISQEKLLKLLEYAEQEINSGRLQEHWIATIGEGFSKDRFSQYPRTKQVAERIGQSLLRLPRQISQRAGDAGLGLNQESQQFSTDIDREIVNESMEHLEKAGIDMHYEDEMGNYLQQHGEEIQEAQSNVGGQEHQGRGTRLIKTGYDGTKMPRYMQSARELWEAMGYARDEAEWADSFELPFFQTSQGTVYGFATSEGSIYLDRRIIRPEHPIHEYTHLWPAPKR